MWFDRRLRAAVVAGSVLPAFAGAADESTLALAEGPGADRVRAACSMCHSLDYILINAPFLDRAGWDRTVNKMVQVFGAPLTTDEAAEIAAYLDRYYGATRAGP